MVDELGVTVSQKVNITCAASTDLCTIDGYAAESTFCHKGNVGTLLYIALHTRPDIGVCLYKYACKKC